VAEILTPQPPGHPQGPDEAGWKAEQRKAYDKLRWQRIKGDPIALEQHYLRNKLRKRHWRQEHNKDRASREQYLDNHIKYNKNMMAKYKEDPVLQERHYALKREAWRRTSASYHLKRHQGFKTWFHKHKDCLDTFTWGRWRPVYLTESVDKTCAACGIRHRRGQRRLWFIRKSDSELWDCLSCFLSSDMSEIMPVEGTERFYKGQYLYPQSTGTEGTIDHAGTHEVVDREDRIVDTQVHKQEHLRVHVAKRGGSETNEI
jgi:hypothetical protein